MPTSSDIFVFIAVALEERSNNGASRCDNVQKDAGLSAARSSTFPQPPDVATVSQPGVPPAPGQRTKNDEMSSPLNRLVSQGPPNTS